MITFINKFLESMTDEELHYLKHKLWDIVVEVKHSAVLNVMITLTSLNLHIVSVRLTIKSIFIFNAMLAKSS